MSSIRKRTAVLAAALTLVLSPVAVVTTAPPAAASVTGQCTPNHTCMNFWNGGYGVSSYQGYAANNAISIHWLGGGYFELRDNVHGGCIGDNQGLPGAHRAGGGNSCPSSGTADWGTRFQMVPETGICGSTYVKYWNPHWQGYIGVPPDNGNPVYLDTGGSCLLQQAA